MPKPSNEKSPSKKTNTRPTPESQSAQSEVLPPPTDNSTAKALGETTATAVGINLCATPETYFTINPDRIKDPEIRADFGQSIQTTTEMFANLLPDIPVPSIETLDKAGLKWEKLENAKRAYTEIGQPAKLIMFPANLPIEQWQTFYSNFRQWQEANHPDAEYKLKQQADGDGLCLLRGTTAQGKDYEFDEVTPIYNSSVADMSTYPGTKIETTAPQTNTELDAVRGNDDGAAGNDTELIPPAQPIIWQTILMPTGNRIKLDTVHADDDESTNNETELDTGYTSFDRTKQGKGYIKLMKDLKAAGLDTRSNDDETTDNETELDAAHANDNDNPPTGAGLMAIAMTIYRREKPLNSVSYNTVSYEKPSNGVSYKKSYSYFKPEDEDEIVSYIFKDYSDSSRDYGAHWCYEHDDEGGVLNVHFDSDEGQVMLDVDLAGSADECTLARPSVWG